MDTKELKKAVQAYYAPVKDPVAFWEDALATAGEGEPKTAISGGENATAEFCPGNASGHQQAKGGPRCKNCGFILDRGWRAPQDPMPGPNLDENLDPIPRHRITKLPKLT